MAIEPINGFYVHDEATDTDGVAKYDAGALENLDRSLTERYRAPDSKAVGDRFSAVEAVADEANEIAKRLNEGGLELKDEVLEENISAWLSEHPEATTTVEDGALTQIKLSNSLDARKPSFYSSVSEMQEDEQYRLGATAISDGVVYTVRSAVEVNDPEDMIDPSVLYKYDGQYYYGGLTENDRKIAPGYECVNGFALFVAEYKNAYVTPEMFGAVGDGETNDTDAFKDMLRYCYNNGSLAVLTSKTYIVEPLIFDVEGQYIEGFTMIGTSKDKSVLQLSEVGWFSNPGTRQLFNAAKFERIWFKGHNGHGYGFYQYSTGMAKQLKFSQCRFNLDGVLYTAGTGNADINTFSECRSETNEYFVTNDNAQSVGSVLVNCGGSSHGDLIRVKKGGCTELYGCIFDFYDGESGYVVNAENNEGLGLGNLDYNIYGSRFEMRTGVFGAFKGAENVDIKAMFNGCNFGASGEATPNFCDVKSANSVTFDNCVLNGNYIYNISGTNHHGLGALLNISNSVIGNATGTPLIERINNTGTTGRVISRSNYYLTGYNSKKSVSNDFDLGWQNIAHHSVIPATVKVMSLKKVGDYWPMNNGSYNVTINPPIGAKLKSVVIDIPQNTTSGYTCTLKITNADKTLTYFESQPFVFNDGLHVDTKILKDIESELLMSMTTAEGKNFAGEVGNAYIEYI